MIMMMIDDNDNNKKTRGLYTNVSTYVWMLNVRDKTTTH